MSQKLISSFFKKGPQEAPKRVNRESNVAVEESSPKAVEDTDSPIKVRGTKKRARVIVDSDHESDGEASEPAVKPEEVSSQEKTGGNSSKSPDTVPKRRTARKSAKRSLEPNFPENKRIKAENPPEKKEESSCEDKNATEKEANPTNGSPLPPQGVKEEKASPKKKDQETKVTEETKEVKLGTSKLKSTKGGTDYDPSKASYHPVDDAIWKAGEKVPYLALAKTLEKIDSISARLKMIETLCNFFRSVIVLTPEDLIYAVYLCLNKLAPDYRGLELGVGESLLVKALAEATGRTPDKIKAEVTVKGDLGLVAESSRSNQRIIFAPAPLVMSNVFAKLKSIAQMTGNMVQSKKVDIIKGLLVACRQSEARFLVRSLGGKLRIGLAESSLLTALAHACVLTPPQKKDVLDTSKTMGSDALKKLLEESTLLLKTTYCECPDYDRIVAVLLEEGLEKLPEHCFLSPGVPLKPMLAHPTKGVSQVLQRFQGESFTCEFKYDGERAQIHVLEDGSVHIYSRNQEDNTSKYPDVIRRLPSALAPSTRSCILDSEAVAWDRESNTIQPFQVLSTRKRKDASEEDIKVQVCIFIFDLLYLNGESLVRKSLRERRSLLWSAVREVPGETVFATSADLSTVDDIQEFLEESIRGNCEGLMVKTLNTDATYEIAKRSHNWLKLKKDYLEGAGDTLDVVVLGGYRGKGKRTGTYGGFLLGCYDAENEEFQTVCKIGTGFVDKDLETHSQFFKDHVLNGPKSYYRYDASLEPDDWFDAVQVWEIKCADLSISPVHKAAQGLVDPEKGISLRFPRFLRIRDDKNPEDATTAAQVAELYKNQDQVKNQKTSEKDRLDEDDFY
ncbi:DNA ligase 1-like isoform X2 [Ornithodoros turicata]|uniref:DNA ligase 1-like isoform X2 n=1 Tax=Ornithodoros turicata TaxID=34597 RepID=UPI003139F9DB